LFVSNVALLKRKDVKGYPQFGSRFVQGRGGEWICVNNDFSPLSNAKIGAEIHVE